ncbi:MAG: S1C family serine protease [Polyangiaceae bacterium]
MSSDPHARPSFETPVVHSSLVNRKSRFIGRWAFGLLASVGLMAVGGAAFADDAPAKKKKEPKAVLVEKEVAAPAEEAPEVKASKGVVIIQRAGQAIGLGTILNNDGRILTALSPLGAGNDLEARYPDDTVQKLKLGHHDRVWDLALLVPQSAAKASDGLVASNADPLKEGAVTRSFSAASKSKPVASPVDVKSRRSLIGGDDRILENALELGSRFNAKDIGSPLIDEKGRVVGVLGRACAPVEGKPCAPVAYGVPVSAIKSFLKTVPPDAVPPSPWLGIQGQPDSTDVVKGVRVLSVAKNSPAADAKLKGGDDGDMIVGVGGEPVTTPEELAAAIKKHGVGEKVPLTLFSNNAYRTVDVVLRTPPEVAKAAGTNNAPASNVAPTQQGTQQQPTVGDAINVLAGAAQKAADQFATPPPAKQQVAADKSAKADEQPADTDKAEASDKTDAPKTDAKKEKKTKKKHKKNKKKADKKVEKPADTDDPFDQPY